MLETWDTTVFFTGSSVGKTAKLVARNVIPTNRTARMPAIAMSVVAAFFDSGGLKAGTPVAIASVPVRATAPDANARSRMRTPTACVVPVTASTSSGDGAAIRPGRRS